MMYRPSTAKLNLAQILGFVEIAKKNEHYWHGDLSPSLLQQHYSEIHTRLQESSAHDLIFYRLTKKKIEEKDLLLLEERGKKNCWAFMIIAVEDQSSSSFSMISLITRLKKHFSDSQFILLIDYSHYLPLQKKILDHYYPFDSVRKKLLGVTGTNGKTTTVDFCRQILSSQGIKTFSVGTLGIITADGVLHKTEEELTTPSYVELRKIFHTYFVDHDVAAMEMSAHALTQERLYQLPFTALAWTNFTQDHLDYFVTMDSYFQAKLRIQDYRATDTTPLFVLEEEDDLVQRLQTHQASFQLINSQVIYKDEMSRQSKKKVPLFLRLPTNQKNFSLALALAGHITGNLSEEKILSHLQSPLGRCSAFYVGAKIVVIDYAHTPDALEKICDQLKFLFPEKKIHVLFGCGGNRDKSKRPLMGALAEKYADKVYLTSDNSRDEDTSLIIQDILSGIKHPELITIEEDRGKAIETSCQALGTGDVLLLAGKGHEDYQILKGVKYPFSDYDVVKKLASSQGFTLEQVYA